MAAVCAMSSAQSFEKLEFFPYMVEVFGKSSKKVGLKKSDFLKSDFFPYMVGLSYFMK